MNLSKTQCLKEFFCLNSRRASTIVFQIKSQKVFHLGWKIKVFVWSWIWNEIEGNTFMGLDSKYCEVAITVFRYIQLWLPRFWFRGVCTLQIAKGYWIISLEVQTHKFVSTCIVLEVYHWIKTVLGYCFSIL